MKIEFNQSLPTHFDFRIFWNNLPVFFKIILVFTYLQAIFGMFTQIFVQIFANYAIKALRNYHFWRLITSPYISLGMLHYTIAMINLYYILPTIQKTYSTVFIAVDFFIQNLIIQLVFSTITNVIYDFNNVVQNIYSCSLWNILIVYLVKVCHNSNQYVHICCMPFKMKAKYYPFLMIIFYNVFTLPLLQFDIYVAYIIALIQLKFFNSNFIKYTKPCLMKLEKFLIKMLGHRKDIIMINDCKLEQFTQQLKKGYDNKYLQELRSINQPYQPNYHNQPNQSNSPNLPNQSHQPIENLQSQNKIYPKDGIIHLEQSS